MGRKKEQKDWAARYTTQDGKEHTSRFKASDEYDAIDKLTKKTDSFLDIQSLRTVEDIEREKHWNQGMKPKASDDRAIDNWLDGYTEDE